MAKKYQTLMATVIDLAKANGDSCWPWPGRLNAKGYGTVRVQTDNGGLSTVAHRAIWLATRKAVIPTGYNLDHICCRKDCVNPDHLRVLTARGNTLGGGSVSALNARKTHCVNGHPFDATNTRYRETVTPAGKVERRRRCIACMKATGAKTYRRITPHARPHRPRTA